MMTGLVLLFIAATIFVGALCAALYRKQSESLRRTHQQQEMLANLDTSLKGLADQQTRIFKRIDQLATDVLQREIYQNADDRHQLAIQSARQGKGLLELTLRHGLSTDEAALIMSLHAPQAKIDENAVKNANLSEPTEVDVV